MSLNILRHHTNSDFMGMEGFVWWYGVVEDRKDPLYLGRVKVRCIGFHTDDKELIKTEELPWAEVIQPITSAAISGVGQSPTGLVEGTHVFGFFKDGAEGQEPVVLGSSGGIPEDFANPDRGFYDSRSYIERKNSPYPPIAIDRFIDGKQAEIIDHKYYEENIPYDFTGETPFKNSRLLFAQVDDKVQANIVEIEEGNSEPEDPKIKYQTQIFSRHPDENRVYTDSDGVPMMSLPSTTLLSGMRIKFKPKNNQKDQVSTVNPVVEVQKYTHRITSVLEETQNQLHSNVIRSGKDSPKWSVPSGYIRPEYPFNHVNYSESGHAFELDDTPGYERVRLLHRSQSFIEFTNDGSKIENVVGSSYTLCDSNIFKHVYGDEVKNVKGVMNHVYNTNKEGTSRITFAGGGLDVEFSDQGDYNLSLSEGDITFSARNVTFEGSGSGANENTVIFRNMRIVQDDAVNSIESFTSSENHTTGDYNLKASRLNLSTGGSCAIKSGADGVEVRSEGKVETAARNNIRQISSGGDAVLESEGNLAALNVGPEGFLGHLHITPTGSELRQVEGDITVEASLGNYSSKLGQAFEVDAGTNVEIKNQVCKLSMTDSGKVNLTGSGSDLYTLLKKFIQTCATATYSTGTGPSGPAIGSPFNAIEQELDSFMEK